MKTETPAEHLLYTIIASADLIHETEHGDKVFLLVGLDRHDYGRLTVFGADTEDIEDDDPGCDGNCDDEDDDPKEAEPDAEPDYMDVGLLPHDPSEVLFTESAP